MDIKDSVFCNGILSFLYFRLWKISILDKSFTHQWKYSHLYVGYNETFQRKVHIGKQNNQNFVNIPYGRLQNKLQYLCDLNGIKFVKQEESYTSKASFWDKDIIPVYNNDNPKEYEFRGSRVKRGLYKTSSGKIFNADVNGALNIMRKSRVVDMNILYSRGEVDTPIRIRIA